MTVVGKATKSRRIPDAFTKDRDTASFFEEQLRLNKYLVPTGGRIDWFGATAPANFVLLTGQTLPLPQYQDLAASGQSDITVGATSITLPVIANKAIKT